MKTPTHEPRIITPLPCTIDSKIPNRVHYKVRYACKKTGLFYCVLHYHLSTECCRQLSMDIWKENDEVEAIYDKVMPRCLFCFTRYVAANKLEHQRICIQEYIKKKKAEKVVFVPDEKVSYNMREELSLFGSRGNWYSKPMREVKFVKER